MKTSSTGYTIIEAAFATLGLSLLVIGAVSSLSLAYPRMSAAERVNVAATVLEHARYEIESAIYGASDLRLIQSMVPGVARTAPATVGDRLYLRRGGSGVIYTIGLEPTRGDASFIYGSMTIVGTDGSRVVLHPEVRVPRAGGISDGFLFAVGSGGVRFRWDHPVPDLGGAAEDWIQAEGLGLPSLL